MTLPRATYRLQFRNGMSFDWASELAPYLARLGISHVYASPVFAAPSGSTHGYDVADHGQIDASLGGRPGFDRMVEAFHAEGLRLILDIVPNHMAADLANPWWLSVVEWGRQSPFAGHFDIDWSERLTLPLLGRPYAEALEGGDIRLALDRDRGWIGLALGSLVVPLHPASYESVLARFRAPTAGTIVTEAGLADPRDGAAFHARLRPLLANADALADEMEAASSDRAFIDWVHGQQPFELIHWKEARRHLGYRRFFEITGLVGVRVEDEAVFDDVHRLVLDLMRDGAVDGLRIDHVDGLADPAGYLKQLRAEIGPDAFLVVEKILEGDETLPVDWPVHGTTGYEFIDSLADVFCDEAKMTELNATYAGALGEASDPEALIRDTRERTLTHNFEGELASLVRLASEASRQSGEPEPEEALWEAIVAVIVAIPVYRTYGTTEGLAAPDRTIMERAAAAAAERLGADRRRHVDIVMRLLLGGHAPESRDIARLFREKLQQLSGPVMAKAVEDTVFYRFNRLIAVNEVGCDPTRKPAGVQRFHARLASAARRGDQSLLATATHDTKRGEDARARLYAVSEAPVRWGQSVERWRAMHRHAVAALPDGPAPDPSTEWLVYQALAGIWPGDGRSPSAGALAHLEKRFLPYLEKALREAKTRTSWTDVRADYEEAVASYVRRLFDPAHHAFLADFSAALHPFAAAGRINSLAQTLIKLTAPGIPDIYQGSEDEDFSLVDPDNRQPVNFALLADQLDELIPQAPGGDHAASPARLGREKQSLIAGVLAFRASQPELFSHGDYRPLTMKGHRARHAVAFARTLSQRIAITIVPRLVLDAVDAATGQVPASWWGDTAIALDGDLAERPLQDVITGRHLRAGHELRLGDHLAAHPVSLLFG